MDPRKPVLSLASGERSLLLGLQEQALQYFLENQTAAGLMLDRQRNFGDPCRGGLCSTAATGMGLIALALASASPYRLLARSEATARVRRAIETALDGLGHTAGVLPHFVDRDTLAVVGRDARSTVDGSWLIAGALWAAAFLRDSGLQALAERLYHRVDWTFWTAPSGLLRHGADGAGQPFTCTWDRLNGETVFLYVLAAGAEASRAWPAAGWDRLGLFPGELAGLHFGSADLGLFVFQYGLDLVDLRDWGIAEGSELWRSAAAAAEANARACRARAGEFRTYRSLWGASAGDGPGNDGTDVYRAYSPADALDGTAHITATIASYAHAPALVRENVRRADSLPGLRARGRYGFGSVNVDRGWVSRDVLGIDLGAAVLALDNVLCEGRVRLIFHSIAAVRSGLERIAARASAGARRAAA